MACRMCDVGAHELCEVRSASVRCCCVETVVRRSAFDGFLARCEYLADSWPL
ncbi:MAG TPA: hypothetical protein VLY21_07170 [Nitrososphaerales archaeon]|nr:hypothetical protein [Nitrososphaerales archaeon]